MDGYCAIFVVLQQCSQNTRANAETKIRSTAKAPCWEVRSADAQTTMFMAHSKLASGHSEHTA